MQLAKKLGHALGIADRDLLTSRQTFLQRLLPLFYVPVYLLCFSMLEKADLGVYYVVSSRLDDYIPFCAWFIPFYYLWFGFCAWGVLVFLLRRDDMEYCRLCLNLFIGMTLFLIVSYVFPNVLGIRHVIREPQNAAEWLVWVIQRADTPKNVLPSIHVFNSLAVADAVCHSRAYAGRNRTKIAVWVLAVLIILSTLFLKQHSVIDVSLGLLLQLALYPFLYGSRSYVTERIGQRLIRS